MSNPSLVWAQLSIPNPPAGSLPFVDTDNASIITDVVNFQYSGGILQNNWGIGQFAYQVSVTNGLRVAYTDVGTTSGFTTINTIAGRMMFAPGQNSIIVTNALVTVKSIIDVRLEGAFDATATRVQVTSQTAGQFAIATNAAATANCNASFIITNVY